MLNNCLELTLITTMTLLCRFFTFWAGLSTYWVTPNYFKIFWGSQWPLQLQWESAQLLDISPMDRTILLFARSNICKRPHTYHCLCFRASTNSMVLFHVRFPYPAFLFPSRSILLFQEIIRRHYIYSYVWPHEHVICWRDGSSNSCCHTYGMLD